MSQDPSKPPAASGSEPVAGIDLGVPGCEQAVRVGRGGFGTVYRSWQPRFHRMVAVKTLQVDLTEETRSRFERELRAMGALSGHPNIVTVYDAGFTTGADPYIVMGYEEGGSLADRLRRSGAVPWEEAVEIGIKLARALEVAHQAGILHRDIKPENVLVSAYGEPKLADFGIARIEGATATRTGALIATIPHAAPELLSGGVPSVASDVYALGSTIYTLMRGRPAFAVEGDENPLAMMMRIGSQPTPDLRPLGVPEPLCATLERSMAKGPGDRHASAEAFGRALSAVGPHMTAETSSRAGDHAPTSPQGHSANSVHLAPPAEAAETRTAAAHFLSEPEDTIESRTNGTQFTESPSAPTEHRRPSAPPNRLGLVVGLGLAGVTIAIAVVVAVSLAGSRGTMTSGAFAGSVGWHTGPPLPGARAEAAAAVARDGRIYVFGGHDGTQALNTVLVLDPRAGRWMPAPPMPTARFALAAVTGHDGRIYLVGGYGGERLLQIFNPDTGAWSVGADLPYGRDHAGVAVGQDGRIYVIGGGGPVTLTPEMLQPGWQPSASACGSCNTLLIYDPEGNTWNVGPSMSSWRYGLSAVTGSDGRIYAAGGDGSNQRTLEIYDPHAAAWVSGPWSPRPHWGTALVRGQDGVLYNLGGYCVRPDCVGLIASTAVDVYDPTRKSWAEGTPMPNGRVNAPAVVSATGQIYVIGGGSAQTNNGIPPVATVDIFTPGTGGKSSRRFQVAPSRAAAINLTADNSLQATTPSALIPTEQPGPWNETLICATRCPPRSRPG